MKTYTKCFQVVHNYFSDLAWMHGLGKLVDKLALSIKTLTTFTQNKAKCLELNYKNKSEKKNGGGKKAVGNDSETDRRS